MNEYYLNDHIYIYIYTSNNSITNSTVLGTKVLNLGCAKPT